MWRAEVGVESKGTSDRDSGEATLPDTKKNLFSHLILLRTSSAPDKSAVVFVLRHPLILK